MDTIKKAEELLPKQEKKLRKAIWWMLQELHQESDAALSENISILIRDNTEDITALEQRRAIRFLENIGALEITSFHYSTNTFADSVLKFNNTFGESIQPVKYCLKITKDDLTGLYKVYENFFEKENPDYVSFDNKSGTLKYKKGSVKFDPSSQSFIILDVLLNNNDSFYALGDVMSFKEINDLATQDGSVDEIPEKAFYNTIKHINGKIKKEAKIDKFLVLRAAEISINPELLED